MTAGTYNFQIEKDRTFTKQFQIFNSTSGTAQDLTGYTIKLQVRPFAGSPTLYLELSNSNGGVVIDNLTQGMFHLYMSAATTAAITWSKGDYDLILKSAGGIVTEYIEGTITVLPRVTIST